VIALEHEADVLLVHLGAFLLGEGVDRGAVEPVLAGPGGVVHAEDVQHRRLAGAGRPHDRDELAGLDVERDTAQHERRGRAVLVALLDVAQLDERSVDHLGVGGERGGLGLAEQHR
jgi:hypothetical protein